MKLSTYPWSFCKYSSGELGPITGLLCKKHEISLLTLILEIRKKTPFTVRCRVQDNSSSFFRGFRKLLKYLGGNGLGYILGDRRTTCHYHFYYTFYHNYYYTFLCPFPGLKLSIHQISFSHVSSSSFGAYSTQTNKQTMNLFIILV